jgi:hypothetical protein
MTMMVIVVVTVLVVLVVVVVATRKMVVEMVGLRMMLDYRRSVAKVIQP